MAACEAEKAEGNRAVAAGDFEAADRHYTAALEACQEDDGGHLRATLLCNRAHARQQGGLWQLAVEDATVALERLQEFEKLRQPAHAEGAAAVQKLRVKALYRRALSRERLGDLADAFHDLNLALKFAPQNDGLLTAAERIKREAPPGVLSKALPRNHAKPWTAEYPYCTRLVMDLADSERFPGRIRGFTPVDSNAVVKFPCGLGVAVHHGHGGLSAIWPLGPPRLLPRVQERLSGKVERMRGPAELGEDFFIQPNMRPADGLHFRYGREGDLRWIFRYEGGALEGLALRFEAEGFLRYESCGLYRQGKLVERWQNCLLPDGYLGYALAEVAVPVKKALGIALCPCEKRLCYENHVDVDGLTPAKLCELPAGKDLEVPTQVSGAVTRPREWWRSQLEIVDPSQKETRGSAYEFAPIGPADLAPEVRPFLSDAPLPCAGAGGPPREEDVQGL